MKRHLWMLAALAVCPCIPATAAPAPPSDPDGLCSPQEAAAARCFQTPGGFVVEIVPDDTGAFPLIDANGNSHFSYLVTGPGVGGRSCAGTHDISHLDIMIPVCPETPLALVTAIPAVEILGGGHGDPSCGFGAGDRANDVYKWDIEVACDESALFTLVFSGVVSAAPTSFLVKAATHCDVATILGPTCTAAACIGMLGDFVWLDLNGNGLQEDGEPGIGGVTLLLRDSDGVQIGQTETGPDGSYLFEHLCPGLYTVTVDESTLPQGVVPSPCAPDGDNSLDNRCNPAGAVLTNAAPENRNLDFGFTPVPFVYCESEPNSTGEPAHIDYDGNPSISENNFIIMVSGLPPNQPGFFFYGTEAIDIPFGNGTRCIGGTVTRYRKIAIEISGNTEVQLDLTIPPLTDIIPGIPYYFQLWYRDPAGSGQGFNTSDALSVIFAP